MKNINYDNCIVDLIDLLIPYYQSDQDAVTISMYYSILSVEIRLIQLPRKLLLIYNSQRNYVYMTVLQHKTSTKV